MKINIQKKELKENLYSFMRKCGYAPFHESYTRVLSSSGYPRFHLYINENDDQYILNLHLDQKRPSYGKETAHSGEYDGNVVEDEARRIEDLI
jgi:hypothetical protein